MRDVLFVDNRDSFVYNIVELEALSNRSLTILSTARAEGVDLRRFAGILLSPDRVCLRSYLFDAPHRRQLSLVVPRPLLGVCLGPAAIC